MFSGEATNTNFIVFGLTQPCLEPTIYCIRGKHANYFITDNDSQLTTSIHWPCYCNVQFMFMFMLSFIFVIVCGLFGWTRESVHSFSFARYKPSKSDICYLCGTNQILKISLMTRPNCVSIIWRMSHSLHVKDNFLSGRWWHVAKKNIPIHNNSWKWH